MRPADKHLTPQELDLLLLNPADSRDSNAPGALPPEAQQHLNGCEYCQSVAEKCRNAEEALRNLRTWGKTSGGGKSLVPGPECPREDTWSTLAAGLMNDEEAGPFITHAATCGWCGPRLKEAMHDLAQDITAEEQEALAKLASASPRWQRNLASRLAAQVQSENAGPSTRQPDKILALRPQPAGPQPVNVRYRPYWWPSAAWAAAAVVLVAASWFIWLKTRGPDVNALFAQAYSKKRITLMRFPGVKYGPLVIERGDEGPQTPAELDTAKGFIKAELAKHPDDPVWLEARARSELLERHYQTVDRFLEPALNSRPDDPELLLDKAIALFERAEDSRSNAEQAKIDYGAAAQTLTKVLTIRPDDPVALFNRAIVHERLLLYRHAIADWEHYLTVDRDQDGPWAKEAKARLQQLKERSQNQQDSTNQVSENVDVFLTLAHDPKNISQLSSRIEDYQKVAITTWLPSAYSPNVSAAESKQTIAALQVLGALLASNHKDHWLNHLLSLHQGATSAFAAVSSLSEAYLESGKAQWESAESDAKRAVDSFKNVGNKAGELRAEAEVIFALQRSQKSDECLDEARKVEAELASLDYPWIKAQVASDYAGCSIKRGQFDEARKLAAFSIDQARIGDFPVLQMRGVANACAAEMLAGNLVTAWVQCEEGLREYWDRPGTPAVRAHEFYDHLTYMSENMQWFDEALNFAEESALTVPGKINVQVPVYQHLAKIAIKAGKPTIARAALDKASGLLASSDASQMPRTNYIYSQVMVADIEMQLGMRSEADDTLKSIAVESSESLSVTRSFYRSKGELLVLQKRNDEAEGEFLNAIRAIEKADAEEIRDPRARQAWNEENSELYRALVSLEVERGSSEKALAVWEWYRSAESSRSKIARSLDDFLSRNGAQSLAPKLGDQTVISYFLEPQRLVTWVRDENGVSLHFTPLNNTADLLKLTSSFSSMCADRDSDLVLLRTSGRQLFDTLIAPIANQLPVDRPVIIENDELMGDLPFQALVTRQGRYLSQDYTIVFSPGLLYLANLRPATRLSPVAKAVVVASTANVSDESMSLQPDEYAVPEGSEVASRFAHPIFLKRSDATREKIRSALGDQEILHFVSHGFSNMWNEGLLIYPSSSQQSNAAIWGATDFDPSLFKKSQLVVLSACSTGRSLQTRRESHGEMVRSLLRAGVPQVIASQWNIDSEATRDFVGLFYQSILSGNSAGSALRRAQVEMIQNIPTSHPYYWAAMMAFGRA